ncbi:hypothetical protein BDV28DRAFT_43794 [Aspergillus coremiiformis]|uniref:Uncharacterized protein n=1 Tax=Aspergillus coremiiformis TaxID=138285 RepID=A0A5N6YY30_9EURO|nr:hypothetical protein BDV28DRAFT_43794 [Aspergillus coremiiformis]
MGGGIDTKYGVLGLNWLSRSNWIERCLHSGGIFLYCIPLPSGVHLMIFPFHPFIHWDPLMTSRHMNI